MEGTIIVYQLTGLKQIDRDKFCRAFLGRIVKTHKGKYTHTIVGFLDAIPHILASRAVVIIDKKDKQRVSLFFKKWKVNDVFIRDVVLTNDDIRRLNR